LGGHLHIRGRGASGDSCTQKILEQLGVKLHPQKTRVVHLQQGFEFLGYKIKRGQRRLRLRPHKIQSGVREGDLYAYPKEKSIRRFDCIPEA
jgi:RNA-directed DNA polymerase